jgi:hypothetical protein
MAAVRVAATFVESLSLLAAAAVLTGILAPIVVGVTNRRRLDEQKRYEEELKRETAFFERQTEFLRDFATSVWEFFEKGLAVSYAGMVGSPRTAELWMEYDKESFALLGRIGAQITMARSFFSKETAERLDAFYGEWLEGEFDIGLSERARDPNTTPEQWRDWHNPMHHEAQDRAAALIRLVAEEAGLTYEQQQARRHVGRSR